MDDNKNIVVLLDVIEGKEKENQNELGQLNLLNGSINQMSNESEKDVRSLMPFKKQSQSNEDFKVDEPLENILILDTETTGLDSEKDHCLEVGSILFNIKSRSVLAQQSFLLPVKTNNAERINKIPAEITRLHQPLEEAIKYFETLVLASDLIVAHNVEFDKKWFGTGKLPGINKPWVCSMDDISWPEDRQLKSRPSVRDLALAYGIPVWNAHRALTDCIYLSEVFKRCNELEMLLIRGLEPKVIVRAEISYEKRHLAKNAGFRWNDAIQGAWSRRMSHRDIKDLDFPVQEVEFEN